MDLEQLMAALRRDEAVRLDAYRDSRGQLTIGVGHLVTGRDHLPPGSHISAGRAHALLEADIATAIAVCERLWPTFHALPEDAQQVLASMAFNLGEARLKRFTALVRAIEQARWEEAARSMQRSKWINQVGHRAQRLIRRMRALEGRS